MNTTTRPTSRAQGNYAAASAAFDAALDRADQLAAAYGHPLYPDHSLAAAALRIAARIDAALAALPQLHELRESGTLTADAADKMDELITTTHSGAYTLGRALCDVLDVNASGIAPVDYFQLAAYLRQLVSEGTR